MPNWALIVGINEYNKKLTGQDALKGAVDDAIDFAQWALDPAGGNVPHDKFYFWVHPWPAVLPPDLTDAVSNSPQWVSPIGPNPTAAPDRTRGPRAAEIFETGEVAGDAVSALRYADPGGEAHKIFVFLAGHGIRLTLLNDDNKQTCFLADDFRVSPSNLAVGLVPCETLKRTLRNGRFDEVMLFLDCCRTDPAASTIQAQQLTNLAGDNQLQGWSIGHAAEEQGRAYEVAGPPARGAFTKVLMDGLRGWRHPSTNSIDVQQLEAYVKKNIPSLIGQTQKPYFDFLPRDQPLVVVSGNATLALPPAQGPLVHLDKLEVGKSIELEDLQLGQIVWVGGPYAAGTTTVQLPPLQERIHSLRVVGEPRRETLFRHPYEDEVHVK